MLTKSKQKQIYVSQYVQYVRPINIAGIVIPIERQLSPGTHAKSMRGTVLFSPTTGNKECNEAC